MKFQLVFLLFAIFSKVDAAGCNCVAFKVPELQDYYLTQTTQTVLHTFTDGNDSVTAGVIGGYFGGDINLVALLKTLLTTSGNLEIANNGYMFESFPNLTLAAQQTALQNANTKIQTFLGVTPNVFIPPQSLWNQDTITALKATGISYMSSISSSEIRPFPGAGPVYRYPSDASTTDDTAAHVAAATTFTQIQAQQTVDGFSVVLVPLAAYSMVDAATGLPTDVINQTAVDELKALIQLVKGAGLKIVTISKIGLNPQPTVATTIKQQTSMAQTGSNAASKGTTQINKSVGSQGMTDTNGNTQQVASATTFAPFITLVLLCLLFLN